MPISVLQSLVSALSALLLTVTSLYGPAASSTTPPVVGIFGPVSTSTVSIPSIAPPFVPSTLAPTQPSTTTVTVPSPTPVVVTIPAPSPARTNAPAKPAPSPVPSAAANAPSTNLALALASLRGALVNIVCLSKEEGIHSASGSGVIFDPRGLVLTNSHIAQYFLLEEEYPDTIACTIRTGNPAQTAYDGGLAYVSESWLKNNPRTLVATTARGTGEDDIAVLAITKSVTPLPLPSSFPYVPPSKKEPKLAQDVAVGGYAAQNLSFKQLQNSLYPTLVFATIKNRYTFEETTADLLSLGGSAAAQQGSSGGGVTDDRGELIGIITTSSNSGELLSRDLRAVTMGHIRRSFKKDTGEEFDSYFKDRSPVRLVEAFGNERESLAAFLTKAINL